MKRILTALLILFAFNISIAQEFKVNSPQRDLELLVSVGDNITYTVLKNGKPVLKENKLALHLSKDILGEKPKVKRSEKIKENTEIQPAVPLKFSVIENSYEGIRIDFRGDYSVEFRVFNEGVAYRFITTLKGDVEVVSEDFNVNLAEEFTAHLRQTPSFKTSYEYPYSHVETSDFKAGSQKSTLPVLLENEEFKILISESDVIDYPAMFLNTEKPNVLTGEFPLNPLEFGDDGDRSVKIIKEAAYIAKTSGKRSFPWRFSISRRF